MNVNLSGKLNINITNKQNKFKGIPFDLVFEAYTRNELNSAIDNLATHLNNGSSRISFASKIDNYVKNNNHFIPIKPFINQLTDGTVLTMALKKFVELVFEREKFLKLICYFLDKEMCKFPLTMGEFNSYRRTHQTKIENSALYYKFRTLSIIFEHLDVFVHLLVAGKPSLLAQKDDIKKSIIRKNYREFYNFFAPELSSSIEELFYWCCDYEAKNKKTTSNSTPNTQANTSQPTPIPQANSSQSTLTPQVNSSQSTLTPQVNSNQPTLTPQVNSNQPTLTPQVNSSQPTPTPQSNQDGFDIYSEDFLKVIIAYAIYPDMNNSREDIVIKIMDFVNRSNTLNMEKDPDGSILKEVVSSLLDLTYEAADFLRTIGFYLDKKFYENKSKTALSMYNLNYVNYKIFDILERIFNRPSIFNHLLSYYLELSENEIADVINNNDYIKLYNSFKVDAQIKITQLFSWCHKFDAGNNKVIPEPEGIKVQSVFEPEITNTISEPEATNPTSKPEVADDTDSKEQVIKPQKVNKSKAYMDLEMVNKMIEDLNNMINSNSKDNSSLVFDQELGSKVLKSLNILIMKFTELTDVLSDHKTSIYNFIKSAEVITKIETEAID